MMLTSKDKIVSYKVKAKDRFGGICHLLKIHAPRPGYQNITLLDYTGMM